MGKAQHLASWLMRWHMLMKSCISMGYKNEVTFRAQVLRSCKVYWTFRRIRSLGSASFDVYVSYSLRRFRVRISLVLHILDLIDYQVLTSSSHLIVLTNQKKLVLTTIHTETCYAVYLRDPNIKTKYKYRWENLSRKAKTTSEKEKGNLPLTSEVYNDKNKNPQKQSKRSCQTFRFSPSCPYPS